MCKRLRRPAQYHVATFSIVWGDEGQGDRGQTTIIYCLSRGLMNCLAGMGAPYEREPAPSPATSRKRRLYAACLVLTTGGGTGSPALIQTSTHAC